MLNRRDFMSYAFAVGGMTAAASLGAPENLWGAVSHKPLDPINPDMLFGSTSSLWGSVRSIEWAVKRMAALGMQGIEPYANQIEKHRGNPLALKKVFDAAGVTMIDVSNGAKGQSTNFIDPAQTPKTIADHVAFARDFLQPFSARSGSATWARALPAARPTTTQTARRYAERNRPSDDRNGHRLAPHRTSGAPSSASAKFDA
jgi:hypothetical protein